MSAPLLTVIVPAYNSEDYLDRALTTLVGYGDELEAIIVNDGSKDRTAEIADEWAARYPSVKVIHQENKGLSAARNAGIEVATGDYLTFVDSDDFVAEGTYDALLAVLAAHPDYDILEYPAMLYYGSATRQRLLTFTDTTIGSIRDYWLGGAHLHTYACNKLFRRELFAQTRFPEGRVFEDVYTYPYLLQQAKVVATTASGLYYYCQNDKGITAQAGGKELNDLLEAHLKHLKLWGELTPAYYQALVNIQLDVYEATHAAPILPVLPYKGTLKLFILHLIGLKRLCQLTQFIHKIRKISHS